MPVMATAIGFRLARVSTQCGKRPIGKYAPDVKVSANVPKPITPVPRRNVSTEADAIEPMPHTNGMNAARINSAGA